MSIMVSKVEEQAVLSGLELVISEQVQNKENYDNDTLAQRFSDIIHSILLAES